MRTDRPMARPLAGLLAAATFAAAFAAPFAAPFATGPAQAQNRIMCSQPVEPTCVDSDLTYDDPQRIDRCERDLENYTQAVEDYMSCLEQKMSEQKKTMEELKHQFRCNVNDDVEC